MTLSDRIAALDGPHRGVDVEIADAVNWAIDWYGRPYRKHLNLLGFFIDDAAGGCLYECPRYTGSLDAAMALVPDDCQNHVLLSISPMSLDMGGRNWKAQVGKSRAAGRTPALALAAAAMKARGL